MNIETRIELEALKVELLMAGYDDNSPYRAKYIEIAARMRALKPTEMSPDARDAINGFYETAEDRERKGKLSVEEIAQATHEMNRAWCKILGDDSQTPWKDAPQWQRDSAISGVQGVLDGKATSPEEQHEMWVETKLADGWSCGHTKDPVAKTHPCLVPYDMLPAEQRAKDAIFRAVVEGLRG